MQAFINSNIFEGLLQVSDIKCCGHSGEQNKVPELKELLKQ